MGYVGLPEGTPKSSILIGFSIIFTIHFGGVPPIFGNTHMRVGFMGFMSCGLVQMFHDVSLETCNSMLDFFCWSETIKTCGSPLVLSIYIIGIYSKTHIQH